MQQHFFKEKPEVYSLAAFDPEKSRLENWRKQRGLSIVSFRHIMLRTALYFCSRKINTEAFKVGITLTCFKNNEINLLLRTQFHDIYSHNYRRASTTVFKIRKGIARGRSVKWIHPSKELNVFRLNFFKRNLPLMWTQNTTIWWETCAGNLRELFSSNSTAF